MEFPLRVLKTLFDRKIFDAVNQNSHQLSTNPTSHTIGGCLKFKEKSRKIKLSSIGVQVVGILGTLKLGFDNHIKEIHNILDLRTREEKCGRSL